MSLLDINRIIPTVLEDEMQSSYLDYAMSVIVSRALPDVRDGLKPVHRRILFAMQDMGLHHNRPYKKSARLVGEVLGKYHPHGDSSVYDAMVRLAQPWSMRYRLVDGQGNYGSIDGDSPAAMRYTETRMSTLASYLLKDIDKNTVDFQSNFDESLKEPKVLPSVFPNLLVNGASGIAVGMATNIPPHNLTEIIDGLQLLIKNPDITIQELMEVIPAPDFPTGAIIYGQNGVNECYNTGRGKIVLRAKTSMHEAKNGKAKIIIHELPYQVVKKSLIEKIADLVKGKVIEEISDIRDESDRREMVRVVLELKRDAVPEVVLNKLFQHTQMQVTFGAIMLALVNGEPKELNLKELMQYFILHRNEVIIRRTKYDLDLAEKRAHILEGYIIALDNLDEVIKTIRSSANPGIASEQLQSKFGMSEVQAKAVLDLRLHRLTALERDKIMGEYREILKMIEQYQTILASPELQLQIISEELNEIKNKFGDDRRTEIEINTSEIRMEDIIADEEVIVTITHRGFIKRTLLTTYRKQNKGGRGVSGAATSEDDYIEMVFQATNHNHLMFFTDLGRAYSVRVFDLPEGSRTAKGRAISNVIPLMEEEKVTVILPVRAYEEGNYIFMCTRYGTVKKTDMTDFAKIRSTGIIALNLNDDDKLVAARITNGENEILIASRKGQACHFKESDVRPMGRTAAGVRGIRLAPDDYVVSMVAVNDPMEQILVVADKGYGKRTHVNQFRMTNRGSKGVISMKTTNKTGNVINILTVRETDEIVVMTQNAVIIRQAVNRISLLSRNTQGVRLIRLDTGDSIADLTVIPREEVLLLEEGDETIETTTEEPTIFDQEN
ncbi:MAG: DNA gyrase subunit A [Ignavibacteria bacterium GWF2_33_9]|nr:MAG: DNA gyrase subunit A [Ignavibacteria bacterium GWF2_33_9]